MSRAPELRGRRTQTGATGSILVGVLLPWLLLALDRRMFRGGSLLGGSVLGPFEPAAYVATLVFTLALATWIATGRGPRLFAGVLAAGSAFAFLVGLALLPLSLLGILVGGIGLLGLTPFAMAFVYARRALEAWRASPAPRATSAALVCALGLGLGLATPLVAQVAVDRAVEHALQEIETDDPAARERGITLLRRLQPLHEPLEIVARHEASTDPDRRWRLSEACRVLTGSTVEEWLAMRAD